jgi:hypothetical protein
MSGDNHDKVTPTTEDPSIPRWTLIGTRTMALREASRFYHTLGRYLKPRVWPRAAGRHSETRILGVVEFHIYSGGKGRRDSPTSGGVVLLHYAHPGQGIYPAWPSISRLRQDARRHGSTLGGLPNTIFCTSDTGLLRRAFPIEGARLIGGDDDDAAIHTAPPK